MIYLDNNATTKPAEEVVEAMSKCLKEQWYNPSAQYPPAKTTQEAIEEARSHVARLVGAHPDEIIFTSGGTEATNMVIDTWAYGRNRSGHEVEEENVRDESPENEDSWPIVLTTPTEHSSTIKSLQVARKRGKCGLSLIKVEHSGQPLLSLWKEATNLVTAASFSLANNETGVINPADALINACQEAQIPVHVDAVQAVGKMPINFQSLKADYASISAHKLHGPKGVGALFVRRGKPLEPLFFGGGQESGKRPGTGNVPGFIGFGIAAKLAYQELSERISYMKKLRDYFEDQLLTHIPDISINGASAPRLPNTSNILFKGCSSEGMILLLNAEEIYCSATSACRSGLHEPSPVLTAMGLTREEAQSSLRFSLSVHTTQLDIDNAIRVLIRSVSKLRQVQSAHTGPVIVYQPEK